MSDSFNYTSEDLSPDGSIRVVYGYSGGERTQVITEPRIMAAGTSEVLVDLWHTSHNGQVRFNEPLKLTLTVEDPYRGPNWVVDIDVSTRTFAFLNLPDKRLPLTQLRQSLDLLRDSLTPPPAPRYGLRPKPSRSRQALDLCGYLVMVAASVWLISSDPAPKIFWRIVGWFCLILFSAVTVISAAGLLKKKAGTNVRRPPRKRPHED